MSLAISRLTLTSFRSYSTLRLDMDSRPVVVTGLNGAGKTNLLEALSFLTPGRGLRQAKLGDVQRLGSDTASPWAVAAHVVGTCGPVDLATGRDAKNENTTDRRLLFIDNQQVKQQQALAEHLRMVWLTPAMDRLFVEGASERRRFLDRLVFNYDPAHAGRLTRYEKALRERSRLLREYDRPEEAWLQALEEDMASTGTAIAAARLDLAQHLDSVISQGPEGPFPKARIAVEGMVEQWLNAHSALHTEDRLKEALSQARQGQGENEDTVTPGPHRSDLRVRHVGKDMTAEMCSTGEQKALLIAILLGHARLIEAAWGKPPVLLLDEIAAHLDESRRDALFNLLLSLKTQVWMTGTDRDLFRFFGDRAQYVGVSEGVATVEN